MSTREGRSKAPTRPLSQGCCPASIFEPWLGPTVAGVRTNVVHSPDGVHFCPSSSGNALGHASRCDEYSSGTFRCAAAMPDPWFDSSALRGLAGAREEPVWASRSSADRTDEGRRPDVGISGVALAFSRDDAGLRVALRSIRLGHYRWPGDSRRLGAGRSVDDATGSGLRRAGRRVPGEWRARRLKRTEAFRRGAAGFQPSCGRSSHL